MTINNTPQNPAVTEIVFILDRSGSMSGLEKDTIGGFNGLLAKQKAEPGEALVTVALFDNKYETLCERKPIATVSPITDKEYFVRGSTALHDAIGRTIQAISAARNEQGAVRPDKTLVVIITDGMENSSCEWSGKQIKTLVETSQAAGWEFLFLGANMDAIAAAGEVGIRANRAALYQPDPQGTALNYEAVSDAVSSVRARGVVCEGWKAPIELDVKKRGKK